MLSNTSIFFLNNIRPTLTPVPQWSEKVWRIIMQRNTWGGIKTAPSLEVSWVSPCFEWVSAAMEQLGSYLYEGIVSNRVMYKIKPKFTSELTLPRCPIEPVALQMGIWWTLRMVKMFLLLTCLKIHGRSLCIISMILCTCFIYIYCTGKCTSKYVITSCFDAADD